MITVQTKKIKLVKKKIFKKGNYSGIENYYKEQGFAYLYLGGDEHYKRQIQGYEICPPMH